MVSQKPKKPTENLMGSGQEDTLTGDTNSEEPISTENPATGRSIGRSQELKSRVDVQEERSKTFATREWVYVSFLKYIVPGMLLLIGVMFAYLVKFNESLMREVIRAIAKSS